MSALGMLQAFLADPKKHEMFLEGRAGTGKTTETGQLVTWLMANDIDRTVCAFTHKACGVLASKLPVGAKIDTLHKFLKKRPGINEDALHRAHVSVNYQKGAVTKPTVLLVDEYSQVGERDYMSIVELQNIEDDEGNPLVPLKVIYIGDPYQLPPVGDQQTIRPKGPYYHKLTKVHRTDHEDIMAAMTMLVRAIDGEDPVPIPSSANITRGIDLVHAYKSSVNDKVLLAWTNRAVQNLNAAIQGRSTPQPYDVIYNASTRRELELIRIVPAKQVQEITTVLGVIPLGSKYKTLEFLVQQDYLTFMQVRDLELDEEYTIATVFGSNNYVQTSRVFKEEAVDMNKHIAAQANGQSPAQWAREHPHTNLAKERGLVWRKALTFNEAIVQTDFAHAMTVHKAQGSTYDEVYIDTEDLAKCADKDFTMYLKLFYVALSRASKRVFTN
jgi:exodeoxyribonuclease-5